MSYFRPEIEAMHGYQPGEQPQGGKCIKLNTNENPYPCSPAVATAIRAALEGGLTRYPDPLATAFRIQAAATLGVEPEWILCGNGSDDILTIVTRAFVGYRQWLRLPFPSYILYKSLAQLQGAEAEEIHFQRDWSLGENFATAGAELRLAFLPNPNSPSGTVLPPERVREIADSLPCPLVVDEAYVDFAERSCLHLVRESDKILITRTLSKSYSLAGIRFGFLVAQPHLIKQLIKVKDSYNCDTLSIAAATAALHDQTHFAACRAKILATRAKLTLALRHIGFHIVDSHANFVWATHPQAPHLSLYERLKENRILVRYMNYKGWGDGLRISVGTDDQIEACLSLLRSMV